MAKKITLRKSAAIQKELFARANNLHIETSVEINEFVRPNEIIETGLREVLDNLTHKQDLLTTLYALRAKTGVVNAKSGISAMLAEQERLKHTMTIYRNFVSDRPRPELFEIQKGVDGKGKSAKRIRGELSMLKNKGFIDELIDELKSLGLT